MNHLSTTIVSVSAMPANLIAILIRHFAAMVVVFLSVVMLGVIYLATSTPKYESTAQMIIRFGDRSIPDIDRSPVTEVTPADRREIVLSNAALLESPDLIEEVVTAVGIENLYPDIAEKPPARWSPMNEAAQRFAGSLWVGVGTQNNVITVSFLHTNAAVAQTVLQNLIDLYVTRQTTVYHSSHSDFLKEEVSTAAQRLEGAQSALGVFKEKLGISDYGQEVTELLKQRGEINSSLHAAQAAFDQSKQRRDQLSALIKSLPATQPGAAGGELYRSLDEAQSRLAELTTKRSQMLATYTPGSPALASLDASIAAAQAEVEKRRDEVNQRSSTNVNTVYQAVQTDYLRTVADAESSAEPVRVLTGQLSAVDERLSALEKARGTFLDLSREERLADETYRSLLTRYEDARIKDNINQQRISAATVISQPSLPYRPSRPRKTLTLLACMFAGGILAIGAAFMIQAWRNDFMTPEQVTAFLGLPVLASIPAQSPRRPWLPFAQGGSQ